MILIPVRMLFSRFSGVSEGHWEEQLVEAGDVGSGHWLASSLIRCLKKLHCARQSLFWNIMLN